jgi:hypothetical protein
MAPFSSVLGVYLVASQLGWCDGPGGGEMQRVEKEWVKWKAKGLPQEYLVAFVRRRANLVPMRQPGVEWDGSLPVPRGAFAMESLEETKRAIDAAGGPDSAHKELEASRA